MTLLGEVDVGVEQGGRRPAHRGAGEVASSRRAGRRSCRGPRGRRRACGAVVLRSVGRRGALRGAGHGPRGRTPGHCVSVESEPETAEVNTRAPPCTAGAVVAGTRPADRRTLSAWTRPSRRRSAAVAGLVLGAVAVRRRPRGRERARRRGPTAQPAADLPHGRRRGARGAALDRPSSSTPPTRVVNSSPGGRTPSGWSAARQSSTPSCSHLARRGAPRRRHPRGRARPRPRPARPRRASSCASRVAPLGADHVLLLVEDRTEAAPGRGDPPRLRRQRQPRAEDPGRRHLAARRGRRSTPRDDPEAVRRFAGRMQRRVRRGSPASCRRSSSCPGCRSPTRSTTPSPSTSTSCVREAVDRAGSLAEAKRHRAGDRAATHGCERLRRRASCSSTAVRNLVDNAVAYSDAGTRVGVGVRRAGGAGRGRGHRPGHRHPRRRPGAHLRALLPGRPGPLAAPPAAPASGSRSSSTSPPTTAAR